MHPHLLETEWLTTRDVSLLPGIGKANSRKNIEISPFIYSAPMDTVTGYNLTKAMLEEGEFPVVSRFLSKEEYIRCIQYWGHSNVFFAMGFSDSNNPDFWCKSSNPVNIALDVAHGDMIKAHELTAKLSKDPYIRHIMSGSICTADAAVRAINHGCTHLRVGLGPGAACTTRIKTGVGAPNLSAVYRIHKRLTELNRREGVIIIADGGIKEPGDAAKYLAAGADAIMMGSVLSKTQESAGWHQDDDERYRYTASGTPLLTKSYRGQASAEFQHAVFGKSSRCPEGASSNPFQWDGHTKLGDILGEYRGGISSTCSYIGASNISDMRNLAKFIKVTPAGWLEGTPHGV